MSRFYIVFLFLFFGSKLIAQFYNFNESDGLPSNTIRSIYKSKKGDLWVGTESGLVSFDGKHVTKYFDKKGYVFASCWDITEDDKNNLWVSFYGVGVAKFDGNTFQTYDDKNGLAYNHVRKLLYSKTYDCVVALTEKGLSYHPCKSDTFLTINFDQKYLTQYNDVKEVDGHVYISSSRLGVFEFKLEKNNKAVLLPVDKIRGGYALNVVNGNFTSAIGSRKLHCVNNLKKKDTIIQIPSIPWAIENDLNGNNYFATWDVHTPKGSVYFYKDNKLENILDDTDIKQNGFWCLEFDKEEKLIWIGSIEHGLYVASTEENSNYFNDASEEIKQNVKNLFKDSQNNLWLIKDSSVSILNSNLKLIKKLEFETLKPQIISFLTNHQVKSKDKQDKILNVFLSNFSCFNVFESNQHVFLSSNSGLFEFDQKLNLVNYDHRFRGHTINDNNGDTFHGRTYTKLIRIYKDSSDNKQIEEYELSDVNNPRDISVVQKQNNIIWFGSFFKGLYVYENKKFKSLLNSSDLFESTIVDLQVIGQDRQLITTKSGKVYFTNYINSNFKIKDVIDIEKDFKTNSISFARYYNNHFFIGSNIGLLIYDANCKFLKLIPSESFEGKLLSSEYLAEKGELIILTSNQLKQFKVDDLTTIKNNENLFLKINHLNINNIEYKSLKKNEIVLDYDNNDIKIDFSCTNLLFKNFNRYEFRIEGKSSKWSKLGDEGLINLYQLKPGLYNVWLKGMNLVTGIKYKPILLKIRIKKPFWQTVWFVSMSLILFVLFSVLIVRWRVLKLQKIKQDRLILDNQLLEARMNVLRAQMNPHFTFNAINSIQNFIIENDNVKSLYYLGAFSKLIRLLLESTDEQMISLKKELDFLRNYLIIQKMRFDKINYSLHVSDDIIDSSKLIIPSLIIQPFIENSFEHAFRDSSITKPILNISFEIVGKNLTCCIEDNGCGYNTKFKSENIKHKSFATKIVKERLALMNKNGDDCEFDVNIINLADADPNVSGTKVEIKFPICYN